jgi:hypothetical protein
MSICYLDDDQRFGSCRQSHHVFYGYTFEIHGEFCPTIYWLCRTVHSFFFIEERWVRIFSHPYPLPEYPTL